jgi:hypothetical protein
MEARVLYYGAGRDAMKEQVSRSQAGRENVQVFNQRERRRAAAIEAWTRKKYSMLTHEKAHERLHRLADWYLQEEGAVPLEIIALQLTPCPCAECIRATMLDVKRTCAKAIYKLRSIPSFDDHLRDIVRSQHRERTPALLGAARLRQWQPLLLDAGTVLPEIALSRDGALSRAA